MTRALVTAPLRGEGFAKLRRLADVVYDPWIEQTPLRIFTAEQLADRIASEDADIVVVESDSVSGPVFEVGLRAIASTRGDPNNVDIAGATAAGIPVLNTPGRNADAVAEMTLALLFAATRQVLGADADVRAGEVFRDGSIPYQRFRAWELAGQTVGLIGLGAVGRAVQWRMAGLGMRVIAYDPYNDEARHSLDELLAEADIVSLHAPVTADTTGLIGAEQFAAMRDGVVFLNTARAQLHDTDALVEALRSGKVSAAGLDHFVGEWLPTDHPLVAMPNVVLTPHIGGATWNTEARQAQMVADDLEALLTGRRPAHIVNPEVLAVMRFVDNAETAVLAAAKDMLRRGLVEGTAGNISARREDGNLVITPSSVDYSDMTLDDLVVVDPDGGVLHAAEGRSPSTEMKLHLACYQAFDDIGSVIHSHPVWATMFAIAHQPIPACIDEFAIYCGGEIRCADYAASATPEVGSNAVKALEGRAAALIANHGLVAVGPRPDKVLHVTALVERTAQIVWGARALGGPVPIPDEVNAGFAGIYTYLRANPM